MRGGVVKTFSATKLVDALAKKHPASRLAGVLMIGTSVVCWLAIRVGASGQYRLALLLQSR